MSLADAYKQCEQMARAWDRDRWLGALFAPAPARPHLYALIAFERELARVREAAREPTAGEIRLVWWREALTGLRGEEAQGNPVAAALIDTLQKFHPPAHLIENAIAARQFDLYDDPFPGFGELEGYLGESRSGLLQIATFVLAEGRDVGAAQASGLAGVALGSTELLRGLTVPRAWTAFIPLEFAASQDFAGRRAGARVATALRALVAHARRRLAEADVALKRLPKSLAPAYAGLATAPLWLAAIERAADDPFARPVEIAAWRRQWALWRWSRRT